MTSISMHSRSCIICTLSVLYLNYTENCHLLAKTTIVLGCFQDTTVLFAFHLGVQNGIFSSSLSFGAIK